MRIDAVNNVACQTVSEAYELLEECVGTVELLTSAPGDPPALVHYDSSDCSSDSESESSELVEATDNGVEVISGFGYKSYLEALLYG